MMGRGVVFYGPLSLMNWFSAVSLRLSVFSFFYDICSAIERLEHRYRDGSGSVLILLSLFDVYRVLQLYSLLRLYTTHRSILSKH